MANFAHNRDKRNERGRRGAREERQREEGERVDERENKCERKNMMRERKSCPLFLHLSVYMFVYKCI